MATTIDITGERHGTLVAVRKGEPHYTPAGNRVGQWWVRCDCGVEKLVALGNFRNGGYTSCGKPECKGPSKKRLTQEEFEARIAQHYPNDAARVVSPYVHANENVTVECPLHPGPQSRLASELSSGNYPCLCKACSREASNAEQRLSLDEAKQRARAEHGDAYDLSAITSYNGQYSKIRLTCPKHGPFEKAWDKLWRGQGCPDCGTERGASLIRKTQEQWIAEWKEVHGDFYDLSQVRYVNDAKPVTIVCPEHGPFQFRPTHIRRHQGCWHCNQFYGGNLSARILEEEPALGNEPAQAYLARWGGFLKPGFTQQKYERRALASGYDSKAHSIEATTAVAWAIEQALLAETRASFDAAAVVRAGLKGAPGWTELRSGLDEAAIIQRMDELYAKAISAGWRSILPEGIK